MSVLVEGYFHPRGALWMALGEFADWAERLVQLESMAVEAHWEDGCGRLIWTLRPEEPFDKLFTLYRGALSSGGSALVGTSPEPSERTRSLAGAPQATLRGDVLNGPFAERWTTLLEYLGAELNMNSRSSDPGFDIRFVVNVDGPEKVFKEESPVSGPTRVQGRENYLEMNLRLEQERIEDLDDLRAVFSTAIALAFVDAGAEASSHEKLALGFFDRAFESIPFEP